MLVDASGNLFGTTLSGGANGAGTVFELKKTGGVYASAPTVLACKKPARAIWSKTRRATFFGSTTTSVGEVKKTGVGYAAPV